MLKIPKFFHELLGEYQSIESILIISAFIVFSSLTIGILGYNDYKDLSLLKQIITWLLFIDISGGVVANLTKGTDLYYEKHPQKRWIFILIHIQPLILAWSMEFSIYIVLIICIYTLISAALLNYLRNNENQKIIAGSLTAFGFLLSTYLSQDIPLFASVLFIFYTFKVLYSFSVFHHKDN
jgi:hypothetical protein